MLPSRLARPFKRHTYLEKNIYRKYESHLSEYKFSKNNNISSSKIIKNYIT